MRINPYLNYQNKVTQSSSQSSGATDNKSSKSLSDVEVSSALRQMGLTASDGLKRAYQTYSDSGTTPTRQTMEATNSFLNKASGTDAQKQLTISVVAAKGIEPTEENLNAVNSALNETNQTSEAVDTLTQQDVTTAKSDLSAAEKLDKFNKLPEGLKTRILGALKTMGLSDQAIKEAVGELASGNSAYLKAKVGQTFGGAIDAMTLAVKIEQLGAVAAVEGSLQSGTTAESGGLVTQNDLLKVLNQLMTEASNSKEGLESLKSFGSVDIKALAAMLAKFMAENQNGGAGLKLLMAKLEKMMNESEDTFGADSTIGMASDSLTNQNEPVVKTAQTAFSTVMTAPKKPADQSEDLYLKDEDLYLNDENLEAAMAEDDAFQNVLSTLAALSAAIDAGVSEAAADVNVANQMLNSNVKLIAITQVTTEMLKVKQTFDDFKAQTLTQMDQISSGKTSASELSEVVTKVADKLDRMIMHSDLTLYTDMKSERKLMGLSSDLQQVAELAKKQPEKALEQLSDIKKKIEALAFNPSKESVVARLKENVNNRLSEGTDVRLKDVVPSLEKMGSSSKSVLDVMRSLGLNHEVELMDQVFSSQIGQSDSFESHKDNFKQMLLKLSEEDDADGKTLQAVEKSLSQITGQQLLNKNEEKSDTQSLFFNIPLQSGDGQTDMKLYVKARKNAQSMDWENCSMYMLVDLKQYGETGIRIAINQRQLNISISNQSEEIMDVVKPFAQTVMNELKEVGFNAGEIKFVPFQSEISELPAVKKTVETVMVSPLMAKEGGRFEWKI